MTIESALHLNRNIRRHNITWARFCALAFLRDTSASPSKTHSVAEFLEVSVAAITGVIDNLVRDGLVTRTPSEKDRRVVLLAITPAGKKLLEQLVP